jgi:tRNA_anti-like
MNKKIIFAIAIFALIGAGIWFGCYLYNKPHGSAASETASSSVIADTLYQQYAQNEQLADSMYSGKIIEVKGVLAEIDHNGETDILELSPQKTGGGISCQMFPHEKGTTTTYPAIGSNITIKGKCTGFLMDVNLVDCGIE